MSGRFETESGFHSDEGIGDKHVPWIHNVRNTDVVMAIDDESCVSFVRLFNEPEGQRYLFGRGVPEGFIGSLPLFGIATSSRASRDSSQ